MLRVRFCSSAPVQIHKINSAIAGQPPAYFPACIIAGDKGLMKQKKPTKHRRQLADGYKDIIEAVLFFCQPCGATLGRSGLSVNSMVTKEGAATLKRKLTDMICFWF